MRIDAKYLLIVMLLFFSLGFSPAKTQVTLSTTDLEITASIVPKFIKFHNNECKLEGQITVTNKTSSAIKYGNNFLKLKINNNFTARTYKQTIASEVIDFDTVNISANSTLSFPAYWVYSIPLDTVIQSTQFIFDESGNKK